MRVRLAHRLLVAFTLLVSTGVCARAQDDNGEIIHLGVERSSVPRVRVRFLPLENAATAPGATDGLVALASRLARDLYYSGLIELVEPLPPGVTSPAPAGRSGEGDSELAAPEYGLTLHLEGAAADNLTWTVRLLEPGGDMRLGLRYSVDLAGIAPSVHHFSDQVVNQLTGEQGIAQTRVLFSRGSGDHRELYVVDYDGENLRQVTRNGSLNLTPRWSPDGKSISYTSYEKGRQRLLLLETATGQSTRVGDFQGLNVGAAWSPTGNELAVTLSRDGNSEIYRIRPDGRVLARATFEPSIECSPAWDPSGQQIAYTSDRTGSPQIYVMDAVGANRRRVTFEGNYNDSAAWSPRADRIAYVSRASGLFTIFTVAPDGSELQRITFPADRDNEDPSWAPDGRHLVVSSNRTGYTTLWIIDVDSGEARALTRGKGIDTGPCWSGPPASAQAASAGDN
ncbi:MAG: hypothetical protein R3C71_13345 [Candidatus Krumholzibacteriia bacterium]